MSILFETEFLEYLRLLVVNIHYYILFVINELGWNQSKDLEKDSGEHTKKHFRSKSLLGRFSQIVLGSGNYRLVEVIE